MALETNLKTVIFVKYCGNSVNPSVNPFLDSKVDISELFLHFLCMFVVEEGATARSHFAGATSRLSSLLLKFLFLSV